MTCADVMTPNPKCCEPGDSAVRAAQIMQEEDIGPVPVVNNTNDRRLVGIVTDRDLALQVVAARRDPDSSRLEDIMTRRPVTCREDDDAHDAMEAMSRHQVRRIPVVDDQDRLVGIIAQADLARQVEEQEIGEVVEDISQPGHNAIGRAFGRLARPGRVRRGSSNMAGALIYGGLGVAIGATLMSLFDPTRGQERRGRVSGAARGVYDRSANLIGKAGRTLRRRTPEGRRSSESSSEERPRTSESLEYNL